MGTAMVEGGATVVVVVAVVVGAVVVVVGAAVVVGEAESDPLPHAEVTNRNVRAIAYFLTVGSCHPPHERGRNDWLQAPTEAILLPCIGIPNVWR